MAIDPKQLLEQFRNITTGMVKSVAGDDAVEVIRSITKSLDRTLGVIDKYLSAGKDKAQAFYDQSREKIGAYKGSAGVVAKDLLTNVQEKGLWGAVKEQGLRVKGKLATAYARDTEGAQGPPGDEAGRPTPSGPLDAVVSSIQSLKSSIVALTHTNEETLAHDTARAETDRKDAEKHSLKERTQNAYQRLKNRVSGRGREIQEEKDGARKKEKGKKDPGVFGVLGSIIGAIGGISKAIVFGTKMLLKGLPLLLGKTLMLSLRALGLGGAATGLLGSLGSAAGSVARAVAPALMSGLRVVGTAALTAGGGVLLGVAAAGLAIYGGYKLYKYLTRNSLGSGPKGKMTRLRMLSYGFNDVHREHYNKLLEFDMLMKDYVANKGGVPAYKQFDKQFKDKVIGIFEVQRDEKEKYEILNTWFLKRYLPAHMSFMTAYYSAGGTGYLDDLEKLTDDQCMQFASVFKLPPTVYDCTKIPVFDNPDAVVTKDEIDALLLSLRQEVKSKSEQHKGEDPGEAQRKALKKSADAAAQQKLMSDKLKQDAANRASGTAAPVQTASSPPAAISDAGPPRGIDFSQVKMLGKNATETDSSAKGELEEGERPPPEKKATDEDKPLQTTVDKVAKAPGAPMAPGVPLEGMKGTAPRDRIMSLDPDVLRLLSGMTKEYMQLTGKKISVNQAFRTRADQEEMRRKEGDAAAKPGTSLHEFGLAIDVASVDADALDKMGLMRKYGFTRPISGETWHIEPAGIATDPQASKADMGLRAQRVAASPGRGGGGFGAMYGVTGKARYKRNIPLQKKLFDGGETLDLPVDPRSSAESDKPVAATPQAVAKQEEARSAQPVATIPSGDSPSTSAMTPGYTEALNQANKDASARPSPSPQAGAVLDKQSAPPVPQSGVSTPMDYGSKPVSPVAPKGLDVSNTNVNTPQSNMDPGKFATLGPKEAIIQASKLVGMNPDTMLAFAQIESTMRPGVKAKTSSATGLFQITSGTWSGLMKKYGARYNVPADAQPTNAYYNAVLGAAYAKENLAALGGSAGTGIREDTLLYLGHHFGASGAREIVNGFKKNPDAPIQSVVSAAAFSANRQELSGKPIAQYIQYLDNKLSKAGSVAGASKSPGSPSPQGDTKTPSSANSDTPPKSTGASVPYSPTAPSGTSPSTTADARSDMSIEELEDDYYANRPVTNEVRRGEVTPTSPMDVRRGEVTPTSPMDVRRGEVVSGNPGTSGPLKMPGIPGLPDLSSFKDRVAAMTKEFPVPQPGAVLENVRKGIMDAIPRPRFETGTPAPQPSPVLSLDKTDSILTSMGDTLVQIRNILQGISEKPQTPSAEAGPSKGAVDTSSTGATMTGTMDRMPSTSGVSMSRRSVLQ